MSIANAIGRRSARRGFERHRFRSRRAVSHGHSSVARDSRERLFERLRSHGLQESPTIQRPGCARDAALTNGTTADRRLMARLEECGCHHDVPRNEPYSVCHEQPATPAGIPAARRRWSGPSLLIRAAADVRNVQLLPADLLECPRERCGIFLGSPRLATKCRLPRHGYLPHSGQLTLVNRSLSSQRPLATTGSIAHRLTPPWSWLSSGTISAISQFSQ